MNIGVILDQDISFGGGFQQACTTIRLLEKNKTNFYKFVYFTTYKNNLEYLKKINVTATYLKFSLYDRIIMKMEQSILLSNLLLRVGILTKNKFEKYLTNRDIDLVYFLSPSNLALNLYHINFIITVWDLCHRDEVEFPEIRFNREFDTREILFNSVFKRAVAVISDSDVGKNNIIKRYGIDSHRITALRFIITPQVAVSASHYNDKCIDIKKKYGIEGDYIFYPAQFWAHKDHLYILNALSILKNSHNLKINAVFSGNDQGNLSIVKNKIEELGLSNQVFLIGFVSAEEIPYLYKQALALVMPTWFGSTNIPPLEAFHLGCPVCYSDLPNLKTLDENAMFLIDLNHPLNLVARIKEIVNNKEIVQHKIAIGKEFLKKHDENQYWNGLKKIFDNYLTKMTTWKGLEV